MTEQNDTDGAQWEAVQEATELMLEGGLHEALYKLRDVLRADPHNAYAHYYTGTALFELGQFEACATACRAAIKLAPDYLAARVALSHALRILENYRVAISEANRALAQSPGDTDALYALGLAQVAAGDSTGAIASLEAVLESRPELEVSLEAQAMLQRLKASGPTNDAD